jgi:hypothetical protein
MSHRLAHGFLRTPIDAAGPRLVVDQGRVALLGKGVAELEVALFGVTEELGGGDGTEAKALAGDEHGELAGDFVVGREGQGAGRANQLALLTVKVKHDSTPREEKGRTTLLEKIALRGR